MNSRLGCLWVRRLAGCLAQRRQGCVQQRNGGVGADGGSGAQGILPAALKVTFSSSRIRLEAWA